MSGAHPDRNHLYNCKVAQKILLSLLTFYYQQYVYWSSHMWSINKVHIFCEGHKILRNLPLTFDSSTYSQKLGEDFAKLYGLLRIYELYASGKFFLILITINFASFKNCRWLNSYGCHSYEELFQNNEVKR